MKVTAGDTGQSPHVPTGQVDHTNGSKFGTEPETVRVNQQSTDKQPPYPGTDNGVPFSKMNSKGEVESRPTKAIEKDEPNRESPLFGRNKPNPKWKRVEDFDSPLPIVKIFCRKLVILGVVFATVYMAFAAYAVILGHKDAGQRVIGTAAGLILLLMGYSIYKVVQINAWRFKAGTLFDWTEELEASARRPLSPNDTPTVPVKPGGRQRSNRQVSPLIGGQQ